MSAKKRGACEIAEQSGNTGYYGHVELEVDVDGDSGGVSVDFDPQNAAEWQSGARFGIEYVLEHISKRKVFPKGARIHVGCIKGHVVDTNNVVIAYAAARALLDALQLSPAKSPGLDRATGSFVFPK